MKVTYLVSIEAPGNKFSLAGRRSTLEEAKKLEKEMNDAGYKASIKKTTKTVWSDHWL